MPHYDPVTGDSAHAYDAWCDAAGDAPGATDYYCAARPWRPSDVGAMLERDRAATARQEARDEHHSYNEMVIDGVAHNRGLPGSVEAFLIGAGDDAPKARALHERFLAEYRLTSEDVPLLKYAPSSQHAVFAPA